MHAVIEDPDDNIKPDVTLDASGMTCPGPTLSAKKLSNELEDGQVLSLISDCPGTHDDLSAWTQHTSHQLLKVDELGEQKRAYFIRKGDPWPVNVVLDVRGSRCPGPVIQASRLLQGIADGEIIKLISNCEAAPADVAAWADATSHTLLGSLRDADNSYIFYIQK